MGASYIAFREFTAVITPHFKAQMVERAALCRGLTLSTAFMGRIWAAAPETEVSCVAFGAGYLYVRKAFNSRRGRWELEFISFTPNKHIQTLNNNTARLIAVA